MLVIADAEKPACIAGVMGGFNTEITDDTKIYGFRKCEFQSKINKRNI